MTETWDDVQRRLAGMREQASATAPQTTNPQKEEPSMTISATTAAPSSAEAKDVTESLATTNVETTQGQPVVVPLAPLARDLFNALAIRYPIIRYAQGLSGLIAFLEADDARARKP
jgi:hypothetical protein